MFFCRKSLIESLIQAESRSESSWIVEQMKKVEDEMFNIEPLVKEIQLKNKRLTKSGCIFLFAWSKIILVSLFYMTRRYC